MDPKPYPQRQQRGVRKCGKNREVKSLKINQKERQINQSLNCDISKCVYLIECSKDNCAMRYIGDTKRILKFSLADHRGYINNQDLTTPTGQHFKSPGHTVTAERAFRKRYDNR